MCLKTQNNIQKKLKLVSEDVLIEGKKNKNNRNGNKKKKENIIMLKEC